MRSVFLLSLVSVVLSCTSSKTKITQRPTETETGPNTSVVTNESDSEQVLNLADSIVQLFDQGRLSDLSNLFSPRDIVLFSPYAYIDTAYDVQLHVAQIDESSDSLILWGGYDGSGEPIRMNVKDYFKEFVYSQNYAIDSTIIISYNDFRGGGNSLNNLEEVYTGCEFVEYYYPGTRQYDRMDWTALRLVFRRVKDTYKLVALVNDRWTI